MAEERLWCTACGTVTRDHICDCNRWSTDMQRQPHFVNYADEMQKTAHEQAQEIERLREFVGWIDTWISNPARAYSHDALEGLFGMTRDKIAALSHPTAHRG